MFPGIRHTPKKAYFQNLSGMDLVVVGGYAVTFPSGVRVANDSAANFEIIERDGKLALKRVELLLVSGSFSSTVPLNVDSALMFVTMIRTRCLYNRDLHHPEL
jgi:hypothetical protein